MDYLQTRPKENYIQENDWQELYVLTKHWKSDLLFYKDDLKFLHHLIDKYFIWITKKDNLEDVRKIGVSILQDTTAVKNLLNKVRSHLSHLANLIDEPFKNDAEQIRTEHQELEDLIAVFIKQVRQNRKQLFSITEHVLESEQLTHLMKK
ncbi:hypothetical protein [Maribacter sp.]|uniref:hypothetical protein n=1 Tax=Maribacter sp. TaxID=1897614 RepID=UPI0025BC2EAE|nr:hypothetical protein [Maribacter sp.]